MTEVRLMAWRSCSLSSRRAGLSFSADTANQHDDNGVEHYSLCRVHDRHKYYVVGQAEGCFFPIVLKIDCTLEELLTMAGPQILDAKSEAINWRLSPLERFDDLRPNFLVDAGQYLPGKSSFKLSQPAQKIRFCNDRLPPLERGWTLNHFLSALSLLFGVVYIAGWNISFPTYTEQIIWRICIVMMLALVVAFWAVDAGVELHQRRKKMTGNQNGSYTY